VRRKAGASRPAAPRPTAQPARRSRRPRRGIPGRPDLVGGQPLHQLAPSPEDAGVGTEELVRGAGEQVAPDAADVDGTVRSVMHRIHKAQRSGLVRQQGSFGHRVDGARGIGGVPHGHEASALGDPARELLHVPGAIRGIEINPLHDAAPIPRREEPGRHVGVVIQPRDHDLVALREIPRDAAADVEGDRGHILSEGDFFRLSLAKERRDRGAGFPHHGVGFAACPEGTAVVGVPVHQIVAHPRQALLGDLGACRVVEEHRRRPPVVARVERGEVGAYGGWVDHRALMGPSAVPR
jgi:hypothetical protein